jgi:segregation and condensation protein B
MEINNLIPHIEALIFAADKPLTTLELTELAIMHLAIWMIR